MRLKIFYTGFAALMLLWFTSSAVLADSIEIVDSGLSGLTTSLALDSSGNPVVSYSYESIYAQLGVAHCNDFNCAGGDESIVTPHPYNGSEQYRSSLALDSSGNPVMAYGFFGEENYLRILHCNDVNCAGGDESLENVDASGSAGISLALDSSGYPVVGYRVGTDLKVLHCNDVNCAGGDESIEVVYTDASGSTSLVLDSSGNPVVSYYDSTNGHLKVLHCNDVNCSGGDESIVSVDTVGEFDRDSSLALDSSGNPVVAYSDGTNGLLKVAHCNDVNCAGGDESLETLDALIRFFGVSIALDSSGNPVVAYYDWINGSLKIAHCNDVNCAGGDDSIEVVDPAGIYGASPSLALDSNGYPVVSYYYGFKAGDLKLLHCNDPNCAAEVTIDIKPGKTPNSINPSSKAKIPVAVLTTESFDATQVDWQTVLFGPDGATEFHGRSHVKDVDRDGNMDSLFHFNTQETGIACGDTEAMLTGETFGGKAFHGSDSINTVKCD